MREAGKSVLILEKTDLVGGTTARSGGVMWIPNNPLLARDGVEDNFEKSVLYLDSLIGDRAYDRWLGDLFHKPLETMGAIDKGPF